MCGIAGIVQFDDRSVDPTLLEAMTNALAHRGPDGEGYVLLTTVPQDKPFAVAGRLGAAMAAGSNGGRRYAVGLGHRRLAVLDLSEQGRQPMGTEDGRFWITYNGEVYNAPELRRELSALGHRFRSTSDTEVVLESYRRWGRGCLERFNGMFAFAVWDRKDRTLFCARDRFGIKPFYYRQEHGRLLFASEIKALFKDPSCPRTADNHAVLEYLSDTWHDHTADTFFEGVHQLQPGECLTVREGPERREGLNELVTRDRWWSLPEGTEAMTLPDAAARLRELIEDIVRLELRADVPVGSCLSGGLDSSTIVCVMSRLLEGQSQVQTFSSCFDDRRFDERPYVRAVLARTGARGHEVFPDPERLFTGLPDILWHQEEPFEGTSILAQWDVMRSVGSAGIKVVLDGQGADELLCGYHGFVGSRLADLVRQRRWRTGMREWRAWRRVHGGLQPTATAALVRGLLPDRSVNWLRARVTGERTWLNPEFVRLHRRDEMYPRGPSGPAVDAHLARTLTRDLPALLHYEDRNAMAFSVEARVPFLDHRVVEWLVRVPPEFKIRDGMTKVVLREAVAGILPDEVRTRTEKMGFVTPQDEWLRTAWRPQIEALLGSDRMRSRPYWQASVLREWYRRYCDGRVTLGPTVWRWINLELWLRRFCD